MAVSAVGYVRSPLKELLPLPSKEDVATEEYRTRVRQYSDFIKGIESELVIFPEF